MPLVKTTTADGHLQYRIGAAVLHMPQPLGPADADSQPVHLFENAALALSDFCAAQQQVNQDRDLSPQGRARKLDPLHARAVETIAVRAAELDEQARKIDALEASMFAVPKIDPTHGAVAVEDGEIRAVFRAMTAQQRLNMLQRLGSEPGHERTLLALMRDPMSMSGMKHETAMLNETWRKAKRDERLADALIVDAGRRNIDYGRRGLAQVAGIAMTVAGTKKELIRSVLKSPKPEARAGMGVFGISAHEATVEKHLMDATATQ